MKREFQREAGRERAFADTEEHQVDEEAEP